jgi:hypothetical protein
MNRDEPLTTGHPFAKEEARMHPVIWFSAMFLLGIGALALCFLFMQACEKI